MPLREVGWYRDLVAPTVQTVGALFVGSKQGGQMSEQKKPGYRDTINLPKTDFPMKAGLPEREPERLTWWSERDLYNKLRAARRNAPVWLLHDGPPYSNGHAHMGTAANHVWKDAVVRPEPSVGLTSSRSC